MMVIAATTFTDLIYLAWVNVQSVGRQIEVIGAW